MFVFEGQRNQSFNAVIVQLSESGQSRRALKFDVHRVPCKREWMENLSA